MGQAFDGHGRELAHAFGETKREVFDKLAELAPEAESIRIRTLQPGRTPFIGIPDGPSVEMPRYQSHKQVWALKIREIASSSTPDQESDGSMLLLFEEAGYGARLVSRDFMRKHTPKVGGYFVVYNDGYESWSPAEAFEDGYRRV